MELSERFIAQLEKEGFETITECQAVAGTVFFATTNATEVAYCLTDGSITFDFAGKHRIVQAPERCNVPAGVSYVATIGLRGAIYITGEDVLISDM